MPGHSRYHQFLVDPLDRLAWHVLLQALSDAPREQYSPESVIEGLRPWAAIVQLPLKPLRETYMAARAGQMTGTRLRYVAREDDSARKRLQELGAPMRKQWPGVKWERHRGRGRQHDWGWRGW